MYASFITSANAYEKRNSNKNGRSALSLRTRRMTYDRCSFSTNCFSRDVYHFELSSITKQFSIRGFSVLLGWSTQKKRRWMKYQFESLANCICEDVLVSKLTGAARIDLLMEELILNDTESHPCELVFNSEKKTKN